MLNVLSLFRSTPGVLTFSPDTTRMPPVVLPSFGAQAVADLLRARQSGTVPGMFGVLEVRYAPVNETDLPDVRGYVHLTGRHVGGQSGSVMLDDTLDNLDVLADCLTNPEFSFNGSRWSVSGVGTICTLEVGSFRLNVAAGKAAVVKGAWRLESDHSDRPVLEGLDIVNTGCGLQDVPSWDLVLPLRDGRRVSACPSALGRIIRAGLSWREVLTTTVQAIDRAS